MKYLAKVVTGQESSTLLPGQARKDTLIYLDSPSITGWACGVWGTLSLSLSTWYLHLLQH